MDNTVMRAEKLGPGHILCLAKAEQWRAFLGFLEGFGPQALVILAAGNNAGVASGDIPLPASDLRARQIGGGSWWLDQGKQEEESAGWKGVAEMSSEPEGNAEPAGSSFTIVAGVDGSEFAMKALDRAAAKVDRTGRTVSDAEDMHLPSGQLDHKEHGELLERHGVHREEVRGQRAVHLRSPELRPSGSAARDRSETMLA
jgi:hypothetical protein